MRSGHAKVAKQTVTVSGFANPVHDLLPPTVPVWWQALQKVIVDKDCCHSSMKLSGTNGLLFPHADLFTSIENINKRNACFRAWLRLRGPMLARLSVPDYVPLTLLHQE